MIVPATAPQAVLQRQQQAGRPQGDADFDNMFAHVPRAQPVGARQDMLDADVEAAGQLVARSHVQITAHTLDPQIH